MSQTISPRSNPNSIGGGNFMRFFLLDAGQVAPRIGGHLRYRYANKMKSTSFWDNRRRLIDVCVTINIYYVVWYIYILYCVKMKVMRQPSPTRKELHFRVGISKHSSFRTFLQPSKVVRIVFGKCSQLLPIAFRGFKKTWLKGSVRGWLSLQHIHELNNSTITMYYYVNSIGSLRGCHRPKYVERVSSTWHIMYLKCSKLKLVLFCKRS